MSAPGLPEGYEHWPKEVQQKYLEELHALYFPKLRWWEKPETENEETSGPRPKQLPPDHPHHSRTDLHGYRCEREDGTPCAGSPDWRIWLLLTGRGWGKALCSGTMIPTPSGWKTLADIAVGDEVFDESGHVCRVTATYDVMPGEAYRLTFSDGTTLDACAEHQWVTWTHNERKAFLRSPYEDTSRFPAEWPAWRLKRLKGGNNLRAEVIQEALELQDAGLPSREISRRLNVSRNAIAPHLNAGRYMAREAHVYPDSPGPQIRTTAEIVKTLTAGARGDTNHCIPACGSLDLPETDLPVDPYVLGAWLGDGNSADARVTIGDDDAEDMLALLADAGAPLAGIVTRPEGAASATYPIGCRPMTRDPFTGRMASNDSLHSRLRLLGVLRNKHVPATYLRASAAQRLALLQGLMDTDGGWSWAGSGTVEFGSSNPRLAQAVVELARSLGQKPVSRESRAMLNGKDCGPRWRVFWTPTVQVFRLPRKAGCFSPGGAQSLRNHHRMIVSAELIDPKPMRCLTVDSPHSMFLAGEGMIPTHNTKTGANWVLEMALSKPNIHVGVCAPTHEMVQSICLEGQSGVTAEAQLNGDEFEYNKNRQIVTLANGSQIRGFSAEKPDSIRGQNLSYVWFDELAMIRYFSFYHEGLLHAMRKGENPRMLITTTPKKRVRLLRDLLADAEHEEETGVHVTRGISAENPHYAQRQLEALQKKYKGSAVLKQELEGLLIDDIDGSLFPLELFNDYRIFPAKAELPQWRTVIVAIDPATTSREGSDESGIVVMAEGEDADFYCLEDCSGKYSPDKQMQVVADAFYRNQAECIVGEVNMTGDYMRALLNTVDPGIPIRTVRGMKGKVSRAQGASSLFQQGRIHMVGGGSEDGDRFWELEHQLGAMTEGDDRSSMKDDRADAFVWAMIWLANLGQGNWGLAYGFTDCTSCGGRVNEDKDLVCPHCGAPVVKTPPKHAGGRPAQVPWSDAYLRTCPKCEAKYTPRERSCPACAPSPENYLARALSAQAGGGGRYGYSGKNWLAGRRI